MKTEFKKTMVLGLLTVLFTLSAMAQRTEQVSENPFWNRSYWESKPNIAKIEATSKEGHSIFEANSGGFDATTYAILADSPVSTIKYLVEKGNDVNKRTHDSRTYIFWAGSRGNLEVMQYLIDKGAKMNLRGSHGYSPTSFAAASGQKDTAIYDFFIANGADIKNEKDHHGKNILLVAVSRDKDLKLVDYFIEKGLDINSLDDHGNGIFYYAAQGGNIDMLKELVKRGVSTEGNSTTGENAIFSASQGRENSLEIYKYLEGLGISPKVKTNTGRTPLHNLAGSSQDFQVLDYFIDHGVDPNALDEEGNTALNYAAQRNKLETIKYFTEKSTNIDQADNEGRTALTFAIQGNGADEVSYLISKGANINVIDKNGNNLDYYLFASRGIPRDFDAKVTALETKGFDFKKLQADGSSLWHLAVAKNNLDLLKKVSVFGVDINGKDKNGNSPLHYAAMKTENAEILKYLLSKGADPKSTTEFGETAHDLASENELLAKNNVNIQFLN